MSRAGWVLLASLSFAPRLAHADDTAEQCASTAERAQSERASRKLRVAREDLVQCARAACPAVVQRDCARWLGEVEATLPTLVIRARGERGEDLTDVTIDLDGARVATKLDGAPMTADPGAHVVRFTAPGMKPVEVNVVLAEGDKARSVVGELRPLQAKSSPGPLPWISFGIGAVSLGAFVALEVVGHAQLSDLESSCGVTKTCRDDQVTPVRTKFQLAAATMGVGIAGVAAGGLLLYLGSRDRSATQAWIRAAPMAGGVGIGVGTKF